MQWLQLTVWFMVCCCLLSHTAELAMPRLWKWPKNVSSGMLNLAQPTCIFARHDLDLHSCSKWLNRKHLWWWLLDSRISYNSMVDYRPQKLSFLQCAVIMYNVLHWLCCVSELTESAGRVWQWTDKSRVSVCTEPAAAAVCCQQQAVQHDWTCRAAWLVVETDAEARP